MANALQDKKILVVGRGSGIARAVALLARSEGARVIVAGRDRAKLASSYDDDGISAETLDITDDESIATLADRVGRMDHVVSTASARARKKLADQRGDIRDDQHLHDRYDIAGRRRRAADVADRPRYGLSATDASAV